MKAQLTCEVCGTTHRAQRSRTIDGRKVVMCTSCRFTMEALMHWEKSHKGLPMALLTRRFLDYYSESNPRPAAAEQKTA